MYIAICVDSDNDTTTLRNTNYEDLMDSVDNYGYDVLDVIEWDYDQWVESGFRVYK
jgi:hypothetical protein